MRGDEARRLIAQRIEADLSLARSALGAAAVVFNADGQVEVRSTEGGGLATLVVDTDDEMSDAEVEKAVASVAEDVFDNLWPDASTAPWPRCPTHKDHPLQPRMVRGRACWTCLVDSQVAISIGSLATL